MADPTYAQMRRHEKRLAAMIADPDLAGELLLLGIALARHVDGIDPARVNREALEVIAETYLAVRLDKPLWSLVQIVRKDIRRYDMHAEPDANTGSVPCMAPMQRREGHCGKRASRYSSFVDVDTGRRTLWGACSRKDHTAWWEQEWQANMQAAKDAPTPIANTGGVLARHLPEINWHKLYRWVDPNWTPPPEETPWQRPTLSLLPGDAEEHPMTPPPALTVLSGDGDGINTGPQVESRPS